MQQLLHGARALAGWLGLRTTTPHVIRVGPARELEQLRVAPRHVVEGLQRIDANADLWYLGKGRWRLLTWHRPIRTVQLGEAIARAERLLLTWELPRVKANPGAFWRLIARYEYLLMVYRGGMRPIHDYQLQGAPTSWIVDDFRISDWLYRHTKDDDVLAMVNKDADAKEALSDRETSAGGKQFDNDVKQALEAHGYLNRLSHPTWDAGPKDRVRSGFTRHAGPSRATAVVDRSEAIESAGALLGA